MTFAQVRKSALYGKAHSGCWPSRKDALWVRDLTERRTLGAGPHGKAHSVTAELRKGALWRGACRRHWLLFFKLILCSATVDMASRLASRSVMPTVVQQRGRHSWDARDLGPTPWAGREKLRVTSAVRRVNCASRQLRVASTARRVNADPSRCPECLRVAKTPANTVPGPCPRVQCRSRGTITSWIGASHD